MINEKTSKIKVVNINDRYISKTIQFKIDVLRRGILEVNYIIVATNDTFSSPPICIDLEKENIILYLIYHLNTVLDSVNRIVYSTSTLHCFTECYIPTVKLINDVSAIVFDAVSKKDDMGRELMEFSYVSKEVNSIQIPVEIMPTFLETFIKILKDKDIIIEEEKNKSDKNNECNGEERETDERDDNSTTGN